MSIHNPIIKVQSKETFQSTCARYTVTMDGKEYTYSDYHNSVTGDYDTIVLDDNKMVVYDSEIINELMMFVTNEVEE